MLQLDAVGGAIRVRNIGLPLTIEIRPDLNAPAHVDDDQEGRPFIQRLGVVLSLALRRAHQAIHRLRRRRARPGAVFEEKRQLDRRIKGAAVAPL